MEGPGTVNPAQFSKARNAQLLSIGN